jgi:hypothetical protein
MKGGCAFILTELGKMDRNDVHPTLRSRFFIHPDFPVKKPTRLFFSPKLWHDARHLKSTIPRNQET